MSASQKSSSTAHPWVQATRAASAARGEVLLDQMIDGDLAAVGLPLTGLAAIGGSFNAGSDEAAALNVAVWLAGAVKRAGLSEAARHLYEVHRTQSLLKRGHVFRVADLAAREIARRVLDFVASEEANNLESAEADDAK